MSKKVIFHVGAGKTGSTAIQSGLARLDAADKKELKIEYPHAVDIESAKKGMITSGNGTKLLLFLCPQKQQSDFNQSKFIDEFMSTIISSHEDNVIYSNEQLEEGTKQQWMLLFKELTKHGIEVQVIYYVRHIADHAFSVFGQMVKRSGFSKTFEDYSGLYKSKYKTSLQKLISVFDTSRISVKIYEEVKGDIFNDFIRTIVNKDSNYKKIENVNRSLSSMELEILRNVNLISNSNEASYEYSNWLIYNRKSKSESFIITSEELNNISSMNKDIVQWVNEKFFDGKQRLCFRSEKVVIGDRNISSQTAEAASISALLLNYKSDAEIKLKYEIAFQQAKINILSGKIEAGIRILHKLTIKNKSDPRIHRQLAEAYHKQRNFKLAVKEIKFAMTLDHNNEEYNRFLLNLEIQNTH